MNDILLQKIGKSFGDHTVLQDLSFIFPAGELSCIQGPSGCGKTTLLRILLGLDRADSGSIQNLPAKKAAVFQEDRLFKFFSPVANIAMALPGSLAVNQEQIVSSLHFLGLGHCLESPVYSLSAGMKRRVSLVRALLFPSDFLALDEPLTGLDQESKSKAISFIQTHAKGKTTILVTHDPWERDALASTTLQLPLLPSTT